MKELLIKTGKVSLKISWLLVKIYIPLSLLTTFLKFSGFFEWLSPFLSPFMKLLGLPGEASISLVAGFLGNVYAGVATIPALDLTFRQITILGIVIGFCHNLFIETGILMKLKFARMGFAVFRIIFGLIAGIIANLILPEEMHGVVLNPYMNPATFSWLNSIKGMLVTCIQITMIIFILNLIYELLKRWSFSKTIKNKLENVSSFMGLSSGALVPWLAGFFLGIVYGAGILFQFAENKSLTKKDASLVTVFIVLAHAIFEDTLVFVVLGANFWWIFILRVVLAFTVMKILSLRNLYKKFLWIGLAKDS